jgi:large subunit ribosomal protein L20
MPRVKRGVTARAAHKKVLKRAKGFRGRRKNVFRIANEAVMRAGQYAYRDRRNRKRDFRALWITRINAAAREHGMTYSRFMNGLKRAAGINACPGANPTPASAALFASASNSLSSLSQGSCLFLEDC